MKYFATAFLTEISFQGVSNQVGKFRKFQGLGEGECQTPPGGAGGNPKTKVPSVGVGGGGVVWIFLELHTTNLVALGRKKVTFRIITVPRLIASLEKSPPLRP